MELRGLVRASFAPFKRLVIELYSVMSFWRRVRGGLGICAERLAFFSFIGVAITQLRTNNLPL